MAKRKSLSKRLRFEIFKRDGYRCRYCGATPAVSILRVDHLIPVVEGGPDEAENLVTSCEPCNSGKGPVPLDERRIPDTMSVEDARERADQLRAYTAAQREVLTAKNELVDAVTESWRRHFGNDELPNGLAARLRGPLSEFSLEQIDEAIQVVAQHPEFGADWEPRPATQMSRRKYILGIFRNWRDGGRVPSPQSTGTPSESTADDPTQRVKWAMFNITLAATRVSDRALRLLITLVGVAIGGVIEVNVPETWPWSEPDDELPIATWRLRFIVSHTYNDAYAVGAAGQDVWWNALREDLNTLGQHDLVRADLVLATVDGRKVRFLLPADATGAAVLKGDQVDPNTQWTMFEQESV